MQKTPKPSPLARLQQLSPFVRKRLEVLAESTLADDLIAEDEKRRLARRRELMATLKAAPAKHAKALAAAVAAKAKAEADFDAAQVAAKAAMQAQQEAFRSFHAAEFGQSQEIGDAERELIETADPRLATAIFWLEDRGEWLRMAIDTWAEKSRGAGQISGETVIRSNLADVRVAMAEVRDQVNRLRALQLQAVTASEVEREISAAFAELEPVLAKFEMRAPTLEDHEVKPARPWIASFDAARELRLNG